MSEASTPPGRPSRERRLEAALRHLLLRHLDASRSLAPPGRQAEVAHSLRVALQDGRYAVTWLDRGQPRTKAYPQASFVFYRRGDLAASAEAGPADLATANDALASAFALEALGLEERDRPIEPPPWRASWPTPGRVIAEAGLLLVILALGELRWFEITLLAVAVGLGLLPGRPVFKAVLPTLLALTALAGGVLAGALPAALVNLLDPVPDRRAFRVLASLGAGPLALAAILLTLGPTPGPGLPFLGGLAGALLLSGFNLIHLRPGQFQGLSRPFFFAGLFLTGLPATALAGLLFEAGRTGLTLLGARLGGREAGLGRAAGPERSWDEFWRSQSSHRLAGRVLPWLRSRLLARAVRLFVERYFPSHGLFVEAGSGTAQSSARLKKNGRRFFCLDISMEALKQARQVDPIDHVLQADLLRLPFRDESLDGLWNLGVMEHFTETQIRTILGEMARVLRPSGRAILFWPPRLGWYKIGAVVIEAVLGVVKGHRVALYPDEINLYRGRAQLDRLIKGLRFDVEHCRATVHDLFAYVVVVLGKTKEVAE